MNGAVPVITDNDPTQVIVNLRGPFCLFHNTANDSELVHVELAAKADYFNDNRYDVEITSLSGILDREFVLQRSMLIVSQVGVNGVEIFAPELGISEFGVNDAEAIENLIAYLSSDYRFLSTADPSKLTRDALDRLAAYNRLVESDCKQ